LACRWSLVHFFVPLLTRVFLTNVKKWTLAGASAAADSDGVVGVPDPATVAGVGLQIGEDGKSKQGGQVDEKDEMRRMR
jgi:hypothetical protein